MRKPLLFILFSALASAGFSQYVYKIKADSVLLHNDSCNAELIIENATKDTLGFLYNKGNGRTEFRKALKKLNDSTYLIGADTLKVVSGASLARNGLNKNGSYVELGGPLTKKDTISAMDSSLIFLFSNNSYKKIGTIAGNSGNIEKYAAGRYHVFSEKSASATDYKNWDWTIDTTGKTFVTESLEANGYTWDAGQFNAFNGYVNERPSLTKISSNTVGRLGFTADNNRGLYIYKERTGSSGYDSLFHLQLDGQMKIHVSPQNGTSSDSILVRDASTKIVKKVQQSIPSKVKITADQTSTSTTLGNVTGLSFSVNSGTYYQFKFIVVFSSAATTTGLKISTSIPAATVFSAKALIPNAADATTGEYQGWITASDDAVTAAGVQAASTNYVAIVEGTILPSANGTLQLRFASEVSGSQITVKNGSMGFLTIY